ncbi:DUF4347 domain-containing protein, partial [Mesorhizobium sp. M7A.F.Ca.CA.001.09.2.1]
MARASEVLFVDPSVSDLQAILGSVRPEVQAIVLNGRRPAARQIAAALAGHAGLDAVHVIAHGGSGRVGFTAGEWSSTTLQEEAEDLAAIGRALAKDGELRLWSCETASGDTGEAFIEALEEAVGADVLASGSLIGAAALGGSWEISSRVGSSTPLPPMTSAGVASYSGVLAADLTLSGD